MWRSIVLLLLCPLLHLFHPAHDPIILACSSFPRILTLLPARFHHGRTRLLVKSSDGE